MTVEVKVAANLELADRGARYGHDGACSTWSALSALNHHCRSRLGCFKSPSLSA